MEHSLFLVPTPIGNMEDITIRAINTLKEVDFILAEDTRMTGKLLKKYEIETPLSPFHAHNEHKRLQNIIDQLLTGRKVALVSDAGTPGISDPGFLLMREVHRNGIKATCLPGATALIPALVMSGLPCEKFHFDGFLPQKKGKKTRIEYLLKLPNTFAFYESPFRVLKSLVMINELSEEMRKVSVVREISKVYEETIHGTCQEVIEELGKRDAIKGEFVVVVEGLKL